MEKFFPSFNFLSHSLISGYEVSLQLVCSTDIFLSVILLDFPSMKLIY